MDDIQACHLGPWRGIDSRLWVPSGTCLPTPERLLKTTILRLLPQISVEQLEDVDVIVLTEGHADKVFPDEFAWLPLRQWTV